MSSNTEYEKDKQAKIEAMHVLKDKQNNASNMPIKEVESLVPKTFNEKWSNYWYHYKFQTIAVVFIALIISSLFWDVLFGEKFDATFTVISQDSFEGSKPIFKEGFKDILVDYDKNGKKAINITTTQIGIRENTEMTPEMMQMNRTKVFGNISKNESFLFMLDQECYDELVSVNVQFKNLNEIATSDKIKGDKYILKNSKLSEKLGMSATLDDMFLCIIDFDKFDKKAQSQKNTKQSYKNEKDLLIRMIKQN